jgi:hypothetical protein
MPENSDQEDSRAKFPHGQVVATPNALNSVPPDEIHVALSRHLQGDWGDVGEDDWKENELSLKEGFRLFSSYHTLAGVKFWIITEADRSVTTILLPLDY